jgi:LysM repeat protein
MENEANKTQFRPVVIFFSLMLALALVVSAIPQGPAAAQNCKFRHTVEAGDTISYVANLYQIDWQQIADANNLQPPYVIAVGQVLCIPGGTNPGTGNTNDNTNTNANANDNGNGNGNNAGGPTLTVTPGFNNIYIAVENFKPRTSYYVRVFPRGVNGVSYRIGNFTTNRSGDFADWFKLPNYVPRSLDMGVCVKNVWTDAVSCAKFDDVAPFLDALVRIRCSKEAR